MKMMKQCAGLMTLMFLLFSGLAWAGEEKGEAANKADAPVSADVTMGEIQVLFKSLADQAQLKLKADTGIQGKISFRTKNQKLADAMDTICGPFKCTWKVENDALVIDIKK